MTVVVEVAYLHGVLEQNKRKPLFKNLFIFNSISSTIHPLFDSSFSLWGCLLFPFFPSLTPQFQPHFHQSMLLFLSHTLFQPFFPLFCPSFPLNSLYFLFQTCHSRVLIHITCSFFKFRSKNNRLWPPLLLRRLQSSSSASRLEMALLGRLVFSFLTLATLFRLYEMNSSCFDCFLGIYSLCV